MFCSDELIYSRRKGGIVPTQLQRSKCRKALSRLCGEVIWDTVQLRLAEDCDTDLDTLHQNISYGVMKILTEAYLGIDLNKEMIRDSPCLEIFQEADTGISTNAETGLVKFVRENSEYIAPEDLGETLFDCSCPPRTALRHRRILRKRKHICYFVLHTFVFFDTSQHVSLMEQLYCSLLL